jgi:hypothetical protein
MKLIEINLEKLYEAVGSPNATAADVLHALLNAWGLEHEMLMNASPDVGDEIFSDDFADFAGVERRLNEEITDDELVKKYAEKVKAKAAVVLFDGYEWAYAIIKGEK